MSTPPARPVQPALTIVDHFDGRSGTNVVAMDNGSPYAYYTTGTGGSPESLVYDGEGHATLLAYRGVGTLAWRLDPTSTQAGASLDLLPGDSNGNLVGDQGYLQAQDYDFYFLIMLYAPDADYDPPQPAGSPNQTPVAYYELILYGGNSYYGYNPQTGTYDRFAAVGSFSAAAELSPEYAAGMYVQGGYNYYAQETKLGNCDITAQPTTLLFYADTVARTLDVSLVDTATQQTVYGHQTVAIPATLTYVPPPPYYGPGSGPTPPETIPLVLGTTGAIQISNDSYAERYLGVDNLQLSSTGLTFIDKFAAGAQDVEYPVNPAWEEDIALHYDSSQGPLVPADLVPGTWTTLPGNSASGEGAMHAGMRQNVGLVEAIFADDTTLVGVVNSAGQQLMMSTSALYVLDGENSSTPNAIQQTAAFSRKALAGETVTMTISDSTVTVTQLDEDNDSFTVLTTTIAGFNACRLIRVRNDS